MAAGQLGGRLARGLDGARDAGGDVDRDDIAAGGEKRLVDRGEVADRRLRGRRDARSGAQVVVEARVVVDVELAALVGAVGDVQAHLVDPARGDEVAWEVGR